MLHRAGADGPLRPGPALWRSRGTAGLRKHRKRRASTCRSSGILQARSPRLAERRDRGAALGPRGFPGPRSFTANEAVRNERSGRSAAHENPRGSRRRRSLRGGAQNLWSLPTPSPAPAAADSQWGAGHSPAPGPAPSGRESERRGLRGFRWERGALRGHASGKAPAGRRAGVGPAKSTWAAGRDRGTTGSRQRQVRGPRCPTASARPTPSPARPTPAADRSTRPRPEGDPTARRTRSRRGRGVPPRGAPGRAREDQPGTERAHWRGRGQVRARSMRSVKAQSATWEPGACSVRARTPRTRRSARSPQPAGGEKKEERNHLRVTSGKAAFCEETVGSHGAPQFS